MRGWVYIITTESMPDLIKIGFSTKDPELRAKELNNTGNPHPYKAEYDVLVYKPRDIEKKVHELLVSKRENKEWFRCSIAEAIAVINNVVLKTNSEVKKPSSKIKPTQQKTIQLLIDEHTDIFAEDTKIEGSPHFLSCEQLANQGNIEACYELGLMYQLGKETNKDYNKAIEYYRKAAEQNHIKAKVNLGCMLYNVSWHHKNYDEAIKWFNDAATQNNADAQYYLATMYQYGYGVIRNLKIAEEWYIKALENGDNDMKKRVVSACLNKYST